MPRRISNEQIEKIREMQKSGFRCSEIARMLNLPYSTVYYYLRPELKKYYRESYLIQKHPDSYEDMMRELYEFTTLTPNSPHTVFAVVLRVLEKSDYGLKPGKIIKRLIKIGYDKESWKIRNIQWVLNRLIEMDLVKRNSFGRYELTDSGRKLIEQLFPEFEELERDYYRKYHRKYYQKNKERLREYHREYYQKHKEYYKKYHKEYYQENKEYLRIREWMQRYKDSFEDMMSELNEFIDLTDTSRDTIFAGILRVLKDYKFGLDYKKIIRKLKESKYEKKLRKIGSIRWVLNRLIEMDLVKRNSFGRYELTDSGRELVKQLFEV